MTSRLTAGGLVWLRLREARGDSKWIIFGRPQWVVKKALKRAALSFFFFQPHLFSPRLTLFDFSPSSTPYFFGLCHTSSASVEALHQSPKVSGCAASPPLLPQKNFFFPSRLLPPTRSSPARDRPFRNRPTRHSADRRLLLSAARHPFIN